MQSTFNIPRAIHVAAVMAASDLSHLPALVEACAEHEVTTLTVCTLPPDLRLASTRDAVALTDALVQVAPALRPWGTTLIGRRFYLPDALASGFSMRAGSGVDLRIAVDYACRPSMLNAGLVAPNAAVLLVPRGLRPGNFLRWQFARADLSTVEWRRFQASTLAEVLAGPVRIVLPRLIAAR
ncbi:MAG: hypothetical protein AB7P33_15575 [Dehalococcoidia bacterium]